MSNNGWSSEPIYFNSLTKEEAVKLWPEPQPWPEVWIEPVQDAKLIGWDLGSADATVLAKIKDGTLVDVKTLKSQGSNLIDENQNLYFQCCNCEALFDPDTKSFKTLHDRAGKANWKFRWNKNGDGYSVYCVKCGEGVE